MPAWTDGRTVFVDAEAAHQTQLQCVVVQACLLCCGEPRTSSSSQVGPEAVRDSALPEPRRTPRLDRPLGPSPDHRASRNHPLTAQRTDSPQSSLTLALGSEEIPDPPAVFGVIRPRLVGHVGDDRMEGLGSTHVPPQERQALLRELEDDIGEGPVVDILSSPVGGGGPIGRLLKRLLGEARSSGSGAPGADAPTRFARSSTRVSRMGSPTTGRMTASDDGSSRRGARIRLPGVGRSPPQVSAPVVHGG